MEHKLHSTVEHKDHEIQDLKEQVGDLMFYLQTQKKIEESSEETRQVLVCLCTCVCVSEWSFMCVI